MSLKGKVVIITGSSSGIGKAAAVAFAKEGADIVITSRTKRDCEVSAQEVVNAGGRCIVHVGDVSREKDVSQLVKQTLKAFGKIDVVVNNAGIFWGRPVEKMSEKEWDEMLDINLKGPFFLCKHAIPHMKKGCSIVNVASMLGEVGNPFTTAYCASKGGLVLFTKALALELAPRGIRVNAVCPGPIDTQMLAGLSKSEQKEYLEVVPMKRFGTPEEVANAILFLASDKSGYCTGSSLFVDGGSTAV